MWPWLVTGVTVAVLGVVVVVFGNLALQSRGAIRSLYDRHFSDSRRERLFLASVGFYSAFVGVRLVAHAIRAGIPPFHDLSRGGVHIHHLVWGILLMLAIGYCWLLQIGTGLRPAGRLASRITALLFGIGAALTLDEFALWLRLEDVYWSREGRESVRVVFLFGALLIMSLRGAPFFRGLIREAGRLLRR